MAGAETAETGTRMSVRVYIPTPFRKLTGNQARVEAHAASVGAALAELEARYPGLRERLRDEAGALLPHINLYVTSREIRDLRGEATPLGDGDELSITPAVAGGAIFSEEQVKRYSRHLLLPDVGPLGQRKLMNARVLLLGAGGPSPPPPAGIKGNRGGRGHPGPPPRMARRPRRLRPRPSPSPSGPATRPVAP